MVPEENEKNKWAVTNCKLKLKEHWTKNFKLSVAILCTFLLMNEI